MHYVLTSRIPTQGLRSNSSPFSKPLDTWWDFNTFTVSPGAIGVDGKAVGNVAHNDANIAFPTGMHAHGVSVGSLTGGLSVAGLDETIVHPGALHNIASVAGGYENVAGEGLGPGDVIHVADPAIPKVSHARYTYISSQNVACSVIVTDASITHVLICCSLAGANWISIYPAPVGKTEWFEVSYVPVTVGINTFSITSLLLAFSGVTWVAYGYSDSAQRYSTATVAPDFDGSGQMVVDGYDNNNYPTKSNSTIALKASNQRHNYRHARLKR
jgi:hypothetical protein